MEIENQRGTYVVRQKSNLPLQAGPLQALKKAVSGPDQGSSLIAILSNHLARYLWHVGHDDNAGPH